MGPARARRLRLLRCEGGRDKTGVARAAAIFATEDHATTSMKGGIESSGTVYASLKTRSIWEESSEGAGCSRSAIQNGMRMPIPFLIRSAFGRMEIACHFHSQETRHEIHRLPTRPLCSLVRHRI